MALTVTPAELTATALTLTTAAQPNITSVGTLSGLTTAGITMSNGGDRSLTGPLNQSLLLNARPNDATEGLKLQINGANKLSVLQNGSITIGGAGAPRTVGWGDTKLQIEGTGATDSSISLIRNEAGNNPPYFVFAKSRTGSIGSNTVVQDDDYLGVLRFNGADGTDLGNSAAQIHVEVDGTPATDDVPGALVFSTNAIGDGSSAASEKLRIAAGGNVGIGTNNPGAQLQIYNAAAGALPLLRTMSHATAAGSFDGDYSVEFRHATSTVTHAMLVTNVEANDARRTLDVADSNGVFASFVNGKVGIGATNPSSKLHVVSTGSATYSGSSAGSNIALKLSNLESGAAGRTIGIAMASESNAEVYLNCVTESGNNGGDFVVASRNGGSRAEKIRVHAGGDLSIANGNLVISAAGAGIDFSATTNAGFGNTSGTVNSEVLDDYEEGSWNPQIVAGTTNPNGSNLSPDGHYIRIGRQVFVSFYVGVNWSNNPSGGIYVQGLPFNIANSSDNVAHVPCITYNFQIGNTEIPFLATQINDQTLRLYMMSSGAWGAANFNAHVATPLYISGQVTYFAA